MILILSLVLLLPMLLLGVLLGAERLEQGLPTPPGAAVGSSVTPSVRA